MSVLCKGCYLLAPKHSFEYTYAIEVDENELETTVFSSTLTDPKPNDGPLLDSAPKSIPNCKSNWGFRGIWPGISTAFAGI